MQIDIVYYYTVHVTTTCNKNVTRRTLREHSALVERVFRGFSSSKLASGTVAVAAEVLHDDVLREPGRERLPRHRRDGRHAEADRVEHASRCRGLK